jgi:hypothetical protein
MSFAMIYIFPEWGEVFSVSPGIGRNTDREAGRKQIQLQYAGIGRGYGPPVAAIIAAADFAAL